MKIVKKYQAIDKNHSEQCVVTEYPINHPNVDAAIAKISGRYPISRRVVNHQCDELAYVIAGQGKVVINHEEFSLSEGNVVIIEASEKYFWEGDLQMFMSCQPVWNKEQHEIVD